MELNKPTTYYEPIQERNKGPVSQSKIRRFIFMTVIISKIIPCHRFTKKVIFLRRLIVGHISMKNKTGRE